MACIGSTASVTGSAPAARGVGGDPSRKAKRAEPSLYPHVKRIFAFERTPMEAYHEYQDELKRLAVERSTLRIQSGARGMRGRREAAGLRAHRARIVTIQKIARARLSRKRIARLQVERKIAALMARAERRAVLLVELAFLKWRERRMHSAAARLQARFAGLRARHLLKDELAQHRLVLRGQNRAALRIQYEWWQYRLVLQERRRAVEQEAQRAQQVEAERRAEEAERAARVARAQQAVEDEARAHRERQREEFLMQKPVGKKARRLPLGIYQKKQMHLDAGERVLSYWKYSVTKKATVKSLGLDAVSDVELRNGDKFWVLVLTIGAAAARGSAKRPYTFRFDDHDSAEVWLSRLRFACPRARFTVSVL